MLAPAGPAPEVHGAAHRRENARGDASALRVAGPKQEQAPGGQEVPDQGPHPVGPVGRHQALLHEHIVELRDVVVGEPQVGGLLDHHPRLLGLPDSAPAATIGVAVTGTGAFSRYETHELILTEEMIGIPQKAKQISYRPPGG